MGADARSPWSRWALGLALFGFTVAVYSWTPERAWLNYDDDVYVLANPWVQAGLSADAVQGAFTSFHGANWYPLTQLSWMLDAQLHGLDAGAFHRTSLLLHALTAALLFVALARLTGRDGPSAFVAAVFALHPLHVESVAWISARKDPLSGLFFVCCLLLYERLVRTGRPVRLQFALFVCLALGLMAKPMLMTVPFVLLLLDAWPLDRLSRGGRLEMVRVRAALVEKLPLFGLVAVVLVLALLSQRSGDALVSAAELPLSARVANGVISYAVYLRQSVWPSGLAVFYPYPSGTPLIHLFPAFMLLAGITALCIRTWRWLPAVTVGWLWFVGMLVPVIGIVQLGSQAHADRYTYLPLIGLGIAVAWGATAIVERVGLSRRVVSALALIVLAALAVGTRFQLQHWQDSAALFERALAVTTDNPIAHTHLGSARLVQGRPEEAIAQWKEALRLDASLAKVANNLAWTLATSPEPSLREPRDAVRFGERAAELTRGSDPVVLDTLAAAYASARRFEDAVRSQQRAIDLLGEADHGTRRASFESRLRLYQTGQFYIVGGTHGTNKGAGGVP